MRLRGELVDYLVADLACAPVHASLKKLIADFQEMSRLLPEIYEYSRSHIEPLVTKGDLLALYNREPDYLKFK